MGLSMGGGGARSGKRRKVRSNAFSDINVTPMVDVMLVLLIIFMVAAPMMTSGVTVDLPSSAAAPVSGQDEPLSVTVTKDGDIYIQKTKVELKNLQKRLSAVAGEKKDTRIFVRGDKVVDYGRIMQVVGEINAAGFGKVALITETGESADKGR